MNARLLSPGLLIVGFIAVGGPSQALAAGAIQRCQAHDGSHLYTDRPCQAFNARAVPLSGDLLLRIALAQASTASTHERTTTFDPIGNGTPMPRRAVASGCARSTAQLSIDLQGALALGDVNRVAESYHWVGLSHRQGQGVMQRLQTLIDRPLLHAQYFDARITSGPADAPMGSTGMMQLMFGQGGAPHSVVDLDVQRYAGCYFVRFRQQANPSSLGLM